MIKFKNIFRKSSPAVLKLSLALKGLIGTIGTAAYFQDKPGLGFWLLVAGALIDFYLQMLPEDTKLQNGTKTLFLIGWLIAATMLLSGCKILRPARDSSLVDSTTTTYKKVNVDIKGAKVQQGINLDSLIKSLTPSLSKGDGVKNAQTKPVVFTDPQTKAQLTYWVDQYGKLQVSCESKDQTIQMLVAETNRLRSQKEKVTVVDYKTPPFNWVIISVLATLLLVSIIMNFILFKR